MDIYHCSITSPFQCRKGTPNLAFCVQFETQPLQIWHDVSYEGLKDAARSSSYLSHKYISGRIWTTSSAMNTSHCNIASHFLCWYGTPNLAVCMQFESWLWQKWYHVNYKGLKYAAISSSHLQYIWQGRIWITSIAMDVYFSSRSSHYLLWEGTPNLVFCSIIWELVWA